MAEIADKNGYNLNISRYTSTTSSEAKINLAAVHRELTKAKSRIREATARHDGFLREPSLSPLP